MKPVIAAISLLMVTFVFGVAQYTPPSGGSGGTVTVGGTACTIGSSCSPSVTVNSQTCTLGSSCTVPASTVPSLVNQTTAFNASAAVTVTASYAPTTGNTVIVVCAGMAFTSSVPTAGALSDGGTNTYTLDDNYAATGDLGSGGRFPFYYLFRKTNVTGGSFTYTCTVTPPSGQTYTFALHIMEFTGLNSSPVDGSGVHVTNTAGTFFADSGTFTTSNASDMLLGIYVLPASGTNGLCFPTGTASMASAYQDTTVVPSGVMTRFVATTGSRRATCSFASSNKWIIGQFAYKAAP